MRSRRTRRVMLIPQSQGGTPASIQDVRETLLSEVDLPSTFRASSGAVRRLVLVSNSQEDHSTVPSMDMVHIEVPQGFTLPESPIIAERRTVRAPNASFAALSDVDLKSCFTFRACVMRTVPHIMKGAFRLAIRTASEEILEVYK